MKQLLTVLILFVLSVLTLFFSEVMIKIFPFVLASVLAAGSIYVIYRFMMKTIHLIKEIYGE